MSAVPVITLASVALDAPGRSVEDSYGLLDGAPKRRKNKVRPGVTGRLGSRGLPDTRTVDITLGLDGRFYFDGTPGGSDRNEVCESHYLALRAALLEATEDAEGCVTCAATSRVDGVSYAGPVQVDDMTQSPEDGSMTVFVTVTLIRGALVVTGP